MRVCGVFRLERLFPFCGPQFPRSFAVLALELFGYPDQCAVDGGAIIADQVHDPRLDDKTAEFDQIPRALAALDLVTANRASAATCSWMPSRSMAPNFLTFNVN